MNISGRQVKNISLVVFLTTLLTWFFYSHENLPKPIRAVTALIETPAAIASGLSYYCNLGIPVYDTPWVIILTNLIFSVILMYLAEKLLNKKTQTTKNNKTK